ncbi:energy-coupling factor transporter transmembrane component T family protein [Paenirhodobacter sp.]|uniref:energy-coupling factor transporter transmembrane component T family protein n=1 Tax=Paenirhodobacter sp. TaxID=1965326 RepID=UPI003B3D6D36
MIADLRLRLVAALVLVACLSQLHHPGVALLAVVLVLPLAQRRLRHVEGFVLLLFVTLPLTVPGEPLFGPVSREGTALAALLACKVAAAALVLRALLGDVEIARLGAALRALRLPEPLVRIFVLAPRYLSVIGDESRRLRLAMRARGFHPGTNRHTLRSYGNLTGMLLLRGLDRAGRVEEAMRMRGFSGQFLHAPFARPGAADWARGAALCAAGLLLLGVDRLCSL